METISEIIIVHKKEMKERVRGIEREAERDLERQRET